ncbi:MAG: Ribulose-phosphate 3-epimerase [Stygiobacter sp.]|nr:MAG: Ribulose-phosphate 3-epimerase [Stygiobacter sp.]KAF0213342.1 MAG: Ribulose-phosphate [Ignavibacteria bacterium]
MKDKILAPSILTADFSNLAQQIRYVELGGANWIHCDIMDGQFVPNITFGPIVLKAIRKSTKLPIDAHLMIKSPDNLLEEFINAGANYVTVHQEEVVHLHRTLTRIKELGAKAGVALNPATPVSTLKEVFPIVDMILVMSVNPGFGGQKFIESSVAKIKELDTLRAENYYQYLIQVDGGISLDNIKRVSEAGCNSFVIGNSIFKHDNITAATVEFKNLLS